MKIEKGTGRIAIVGEKHTVKLPRIYGITAVKFLWELRHTTFKKALACITAMEDNPWGFGFLVYRGWRQNMRESSLSGDFRHIVVPTRFSLFGLINIQDTAPDIDLPDGEIYIGIIERIKSSAGARLQDVIDMRSATHTIPNSKNYGLHEGTIKLRDYGEKGIAELLQRFGTEVQQVLEEKMATIQAR